MFFTDDPQSVRRIRNYAPLYLEQILPTASEVGGMVRPCIAHLSRDFLHEILQHRMAQPWVRELGYSVVDQIWQKSLAKGALEIDFSNVDEQKERALAYLLARNAMARAIDAIDRADAQFGHSLASNVISELDVDLSKDLSRPAHEHDDPYIR